MNHRNFDFFQSPNHRHFLFPLPQTTDIQTNLFEQFHQSDQEQQRAQKDWLQPFKPGNFHKQDPELNVNRQSVQQAITHKLQFSGSKQLQMPITPLKIPKIQLPDQEYTIKNYSKNSQISLRTLSALAYQFILMQKKTNFKEVLEKILAQLQGQGQIKIEAFQKRGMICLKRRVYDCLNVLVASGLLKRAGRSIMTKKKEWKELATQYENLNKFYQDVEKKVILKRQARKETSCKLEGFRQIVDKNRKIKQQKMISLNTMAFPLIFLALGLTQRQCSDKKEEKHQDIQVRRQDKVRFWRNSQNQLNGRLQKQVQYKLYGELEALGLWRNKNQSGNGKDDQILKRR